MPNAQFTTPAASIDTVSSHDLRQIALYDLLHFAIENEQPLVVLYATKGITEKARVIIPYDLYETKNGADILRGHDSLSREFHSFRVDRIKAAHHLTTV